MKSSGLVATALIMVLPFCVRAQSVEMTLSCEYDKPSDSEKFSAIVRLQSPQPPMIYRTRATIEATTYGCSNYEGWYSDQEVGGACEDRSTKISASLTINRINGTFTHTVFMGERFGSPAYGRCTVVKRLF